MVKTNDSTFSIEIKLLVSMISINCLFTTSLLPALFQPGPDPIKLFLAPIEATLKFQQIRMRKADHMTSENA